MKNLSIDDLMSEIWAAGRNCDREKYDDATEEINRRFAEFKEELDDIYAQHKMVMAEKCAPDEKHCTCVPMLRRDLKKVTEELNEIKKCHDCPFCGQRQCMREKREKPKISDHARYPEWK